ncbi:hypothetical protein Ade02nite_04970 [Paractinoplanes deccanensis]|uniref:Uncharacterized protein n=1 Tax=Paractinoplanes deccanensis TaxID=113561 RepID=A0ABQ3XVV7_9ACTN|nr:hypothetical protein Ade02nite_04970 [Actinoplanes deccanensis]
MRIIAIAYVSPLPGSDQSRGTETLAQSYVMPAAPRPTSWSGISGHGCQSAPLALGAAEAEDVPCGAGVASPDPSGANEGTVQPETVTTSAARTATKERRGTMDLPWS